MRDSLRARLILWYAGVLASVVLVFGVAVSYQSWRSMVAALDQELRLHALQVAAALRPAGDGRFDVDLTPEVLEYFRQESDQPYYVIWAPGGELIDRSEPSRDATTPPSPGARTIDGRRELSVPAPAGAVVLVGRDLAGLENAAWSLGVSVAVGGMTALAAAILGGWFIAGRALAPIARISRVARAMSDGDLDARIPVEHTETELGQVASALNAAFDRLQLVIDQQRRFTADASHELRTPVAVMRAELEWALGRARTAEEYRESLIVCRRAVERFQETTDALLRTVRADVSGRPDVTTAVHVAPLVNDVVGWLEPLADERDVHLVIAGGDLTVGGDAGQLKEAINNIVANAIQYNRPGGRVSITLTPDTSVGRIEIADTGIGIPAWAVPRVFDRFFRVDDARSREAGGAGLGLSVAHAIVNAHGGTLACSSSEGSGSVFLITLPLRSA